MQLILNAFMEPQDGAGFIAWIDTPKNFRMLVQGSTKEETAKELIISLKVALSYQLGFSIEKMKVQQMENESIYNDLIQDLSTKGQRELKLQLA
jgi:hypothetical protein